MRICFISRRYFPAISGMSVYAQNYLSQMVKLGHDVVMISQYRNDLEGTRIYGGGPPPIVPGVTVEGLESHGEQQINVGKPADFEADINAMVETAVSHHLRKPFDIVHAQYAYPNGLAAIEISRRLGVPNVVSIQGGDGHWVGLCCETHKRAMHAVLNHANELIVGSQSFAEEIHINHGIATNRFTIITGAIDASHFYPRDDRLPGLVGSPAVLLYHGRVDKRKGVLELIEAFNKMVLNGRHLRLTISGIGPDLEESKQLVSLLNLNNLVDFTGYVSYQDVPAVYRNADLFITPTWSEGFSNTILEAMACGLPIVAARAIGVVDCLTDDKDALFHEVHDVEGLATQICRLLDDDLLRRSLVDNALKEIQNKYRWELVAEKLVGRLNMCLNRSPDNRWIDNYSPFTAVSDADLSCRFRKAPHLL